MTKVDREPPKHEDGIKILPDKSQLVYEWLALRHAISTELPVKTSDSDDVLELGHLYLGDEVLDGFKFGIHYDSAELRYELQALIVPKQDGMNRPETIFQLIQSQKDTPSPFNLTPIRRFLLKKIVGKNFSVDLNQKEKVIEIHSQEDSERKVILHELNSQQGTAYCFHLDRFFENSYEAFKGDYETFSELASMMIDSIYQSKNTSAPDETIVLAPPKNTEAMVDLNKKLLRRNKIMMSSMGVGEEDFSEEIKARMILEKRPDVSFEDVGGLEKAKEELKDIVAALKDPESFTKWGTFPPKGVLLYGPPGTGKTLLARALAHESDATIYIVKVADIFHALFGRSEKFIQAVFNEARQNGSSIIFIDEIDALSAHRDHSSQVISSIVSSLLTNMDGIESANSNMVVIGATNRLGAIDEALLRPGRFDMLVEIPLPKEKEIEKIFGIHIRAANNIANRNCFTQELDVKKLAKISEEHGFSGADIKELIRRSLAKKRRLEKEGQSPGLVATANIEDEIKDYERIKKDREQMGFRIQNGNK